MGSTVQPETDTKQKRSHVSKQEIQNFVEEHIIPVLKENDGSLTRGVIKKEFSNEIQEELSITVHTFVNRLYKSDIKEEVGLPEHENAVEVWADALEEKHGRFRYNQFKQYLDKQTINNYSPGHNRNRLFNELDKRDSIEYNVSRSSEKNKPFTIFIKTKEKPFQEHRERLPNKEQAEEIFDYFLGKGCAPKTIVAGLRYVYKDIEDDGDVTYTSVAEEAGCCGVSVSKMQDKILDEFDLEVSE